MTHFDTTSHPAFSPDCAAFKTLSALYSEMDRTFDHIARQYHFACNGCEDNCCRTRFYHHTYVEFAYLMSGYHHLDPAVRQATAERAETVCRLLKDTGASETPMRIMCPLNENEKCILYIRRPMICRLHGLPHEVRRPGQEPAYSPGCADFDRQCSRTDYIPFDRTRFYIQLAGLEKNFRTTFSLTGKLKLTVAEMICAQ